MRVCVDIQSAVGQCAGIGRYTRTLVQHLAATAGHDELELFYFDFRRRGLAFDPGGARPHPVRWCPGAAMQKLWKLADAPPFEWLAGRADVYHFPNFAIPPGRAGKRVVTIHDVSFVRHPEFTEARNLAYLNATIGRTLRRADAILTISRFSAGEIVHNLHAPPDRVHAIHLAVSPLFQPAPPDRIARVRRMFGLDTRPYLLTVSTLEPRKNIPFLAEVFERMPWFDGSLVIAGPHGWKHAPILERLRASPRADAIRNIRFVPDDDLPALYSGAALFAFPSFYEGFGLPPLEAMACGTPVVSSAGGSLPEVLGEAATILDTFDAGRWAEAIRSILDDGARRAALAEAGRRQAARYTWSATAAATWALYRTLAS